MNNTKTRYIINPLLLRPLLPIFLHTAGDSTKTEIHPLLGRNLAVFFILVGL